MSRQIIILLEDGATLPAGLPAMSAQVPTTDPDTERYIIMTDRADARDISAAGFLWECLHIYHQDHSNPYGIGTMDHVRANELTRIYNILCEMLKEDPPAGEDPAEN